MKATTHNKQRPGDRGTKRNRQTETERQRDRQNTHRHIVYFVCFSMTMIQSFLALQRDLSSNPTSLNDCGRIVQIVLTPRPGRRWTPSDRPLGSRSCADEPWRETGNPDATTSGEPANRGVDSIDLERLPNCSCQLAPVTNVPPRPDVFVHPM